MFSSIVVGAYTVLGFAVAFIVIAVVGIALYLREERLEAQDSDNLDSRNTP